MTDRILVVDDDKKIVKMIKDFLEMEQYQVITAYDGETAIRQTQQNPDLILLDINMPGMNRLEVCRRISMLRMSRTMRWDSCVMLLNRCVCSLKIIIK